ncbi:unnamed protein product [Sphenostylis stenocarpa]|uniref:Uncharacterized protein n=1 Tax=Sphenostylis stenocarpa TaxID=92480 RepID=A0AA86VHK5_9FABA|nr:unnamed protein product [Sphenostylis stenocarpa]
MVSENDEMPIGWPFGLGILNTRLRDVESPTAPVEPHSMHIPSTSFSSFSSSNLDTESTASFFQDNSVSLGHLIGLRAGEKGRLYFPNSLRIEEREEKTLANGSSSDDASEAKHHHCDNSKLKARNKEAQTHNSHAQGKTGPLRT